MNNAAQISFVFSTIVVIIVMGFVLFTFNDTINSLREDTLQETPQEDILTRFILHALMPILWTGYGLLSIFAIKFAVDSSEGVI